MLKLSNPRQLKVWIIKSIISIFTLSAFILMPLIPNVAEAATVAQPVISPSGGTIYSNSPIRITSSTSGATIRYTTNGSTPTASSTLYSAPFYLYAAGTYTIKAIAIKSGYTNSVVSQATITTTNSDAANRAFLLTYGISVKTPTCTSITQSGCTSLNGMQQSTLNELVAMEQVCDRWKVPIGPLQKNGNYCKIFVSGGTEGTDGNPHKGTGVCSHIGGGKIDIRSTLYDSTISSDRFILTSGFFKAKTPPKRGDGAYWYSRTASGAVYADERPSTFGTGPHWDIAKPGC